MRTRRTIKGRLVIAIFLVGCVPLLIGLALAAMASMRSLSVVIGGNVQAIASQASERVSMLVASEVQGLRLLASAPLRVRAPVALANQSYPRPASRLAETLRDRTAAWEKNPDFSSAVLQSPLSRYLVERKVSEGDKVVGLLITDEHGAVVAASSQPDRYLFREERWWNVLQADAAAAVWISDVISGRKGTFRSPEETIDIAVPIWDDLQHKMIGTIKASYHFDALFGLVNQIRIGQTGHAMLFNAAGQPLICPILPRQAHRIPEALMRHIVSNEPGWIIAEDDGHGARDTVVGFAPVRGLGSSDNPWHIFVRQHPSESFAPVHEQLKNSALIGVVMVLLLAVLGRYVAARVAHPINLLKTKVDAIRQGRAPQAQDIKTGDEFEELGTAIDRMAANLQSSHAELEGLNRDLARRIEEKTAEAAGQMRKLEVSERLAALGKVASGIAHEINNPLGIILNRIECMESEAAHLPVPEQFARDLSALRAQAERIFRVTHGMLSLSRGAPITLKPVDTACVVKTVLGIVEDRVSARGITIELDLEADLIPVMADRTRLETVVLNLLNNAIDAVHGAGHGKISIQTRRENKPDGEWVAITVADSGPGIPTDLQAKIFDPFFTTKPPGQGNGLGLFLSYGIIAEHRGRLEVRNGDIGAVFTVTLPAIARGTEIHLEAAWESRARS
jgi:signal transduction histidine kinase